MLLKQDGLILSPSMVDDWHQGVCDKIEPLYNRDLDACKRAAMMYSLFGACKVLDKNPERWLCYVLKHIDTTPEDKLYTLLPEFWEDGEQ